MRESQQRAIAAAQQHWGRTWKRKLNEAWATAKYPAALKLHQAELQQIRNQFGPSWLARIN